MTFLRRGETLLLSGVRAPNRRELVAPKQVHEMPLTKLDPIDRKILAELQADGRMTNVELSRRVGISAPPCLRRVRHLVGLIRGYHAEIDPRALGLEVQVFAMVGLSSQAEVDLSAFEAKARSWPLVRECHMLNGEIDFILKCVAPDLSTFQTFLTEELTAAPKVASVKTSLVIRCAKNEPIVPFEVFESRVDDR
jgi:DNA-binding Lrp family transcriptional regulator